MTVDHADTYPAMTVDHADIYPAKMVVNLSLSGSTVVLVPIQGPSERGTETRPIKMSDLLVR